MAHQATDRVVAGLLWTGWLLVGLGTLTTIYGVIWTSTEKDLLGAVKLAALAFGLPALGCFGAAVWMDREADRMEARTATSGRELRVSKNAFAEPLRHYAIAVVAVVAAWLLRKWLDPYLPGYVPFSTFYLAVVVTGWLAGFGPAAAATMLSAVIARFNYMEPTGSLEINTVLHAVSLGVFVIAGIIISAVTAALHAALRRIQALSAELDELRRASKRP